MLIPQGYQTADGLQTRGTGGGGTTGENGVDSERHGVQIGLFRIGGDVDAAVEGSAQTAAGVHQRSHSGFIQIAVRGQAADDKAGCAGLFQFGDLQAQQLDLIGIIKEISCAVTHETADGNIGFLPNLAQERGVRRQASHS